LDAVGGFYVLVGPINGYATGGTPALATATPVAEGCGGFAAAAFRVVTFHFFAFAARFRADFSFRFRVAFLAADLLPLGMGVPFALGLPGLPLAETREDRRPYNP
jgi:hypothetical protein